MTLVTRRRLVLPTACLLLAASLAAGRASAQQRTLIGSGTKHARATIQTVSVTRTRAQLLVTLFVDPGWHVSWRNPGETGLPTRLSWSLPAGVKAVSETWPVPVISHTTVGDTHTLEGAVPWLVDFALDSAHAEERLLSLTMRYGICKDVCIPEQLTVQGALPANVSPRREPIPAGLRSRLSTDGGVIAARRLSPTQLCLDRVPMSSPGVMPEVVADSGVGLEAALRLTDRPGRPRAPAWP